MQAQPRTDETLVKILASSKDSLLAKVFSMPDEYRYQVIYTAIERDKNNVPSFTDYYYNVDARRYFNPASVVKMPLAFLSLEKLNDLKKPGINKYTYMQFDSAWSKQRVLYRDSTAENELPSIAQFIRKAFLISDNDAYNRMYQFVGQEQINRRLQGMGYKETRITRQFMGMNADENRRTNPIKFIDRQKRVLYEQPILYNRDSFDFSVQHKMGKAYLNARDSLINEPIDFTRANNYPLFDMHQTLRSVMFPASVPATQRFRLTNEDYKFLYRYMSQYPSETDYPKYDTATFYDSYAKFFFRHGNHAMPDGVRVFNKVGWAYGCLTDVSYVADFKNRVEFMLSVTIYVNSDGVLNDDKYEYETIGWPFLYAVGQAIYEHEKKRPRKFKPDLSAFRMTYTPRKIDSRIAIREVDN
jgi:hypothetical protein